MELTIGQMKLLIEVLNEGMPSDEKKRQKLADLCYTMEVELKTK